MRRLGCVLHPIYAVLLIGDNSFCKLVQLYDLRQVLRLLITLAIFQHSLGVFALSVIALGLVVGVNLWLESVDFRWVALLLDGVLLAETWNAFLPWARRDLLVLDRRVKLTSEILVDILITLSLQQFSFDLLLKMLR